MLKLFPSCETLIVKQLCVPEKSTILFSFVYNCSPYGTIILKNENENHKQNKKDKTSAYSIISCECFCVFSKQPREGPLRHWSLPPWYQVNPPRQDASYLDVLWGCGAGLLWTLLLGLARGTRHTWSREGKQDQRIPWQISCTTAKLAHSPKISLHHLNVVMWLLVWASP